MKESFLGFISRLPIVWLVLTHRNVVIHYAKKMPMTYGNLRVRTGAAFVGQQLMEPVMQRALAKTSQEIAQNVEHIEKSHKVHVTDMAYLEEDAKD